LDETPLPLNIMPDSLPYKQIGDGLPVSPLPFPLQDTQCLCRWIAEITGAAETEVAARLAEETKAMGSNVLRALRARNLPLHTWHEAMADFYAGTDAFLYETPVWNARSLKARIRQWIASYLSRHSAGQQILIYGDGLGFDSAYLAQCGHDVTYFEVSHRCRAFAERVFRQVSTPIRVATTEDDLAGREYDAVVCLDVLEHTPRPEELVARLARYLRPEGRLIVSAPFYLTTEAAATHLECNRKFSGDLRRLYGACGLELIDGRPFWDPIVLGRRQAASRAMPFAARANLWLLRSTGALLAVARWWNLPHKVVSAWLGGAVAT
jgi:2-polyprenyl-3-methyl-5-hydroxy-6-metoxy-1,4-benzoquinol methylase